MFRSCCVRVEMISSDREGGRGSMRTLSKWPPYSGLVKSAQSLQPTLPGKCASQSSLPAKKLRKGFFFFLNYTHIIHFQAFPFVSKEETSFFFHTFILALKCHRLLNTQWQYFPIASFLGSPVSRKVTNASTSNRLISISVLLIQTGNLAYRERNECQQKFGLIL